MNIPNRRQCKFRRTLFQSLDGHGRIRWFNSVDICSFSGWSSSQSSSIKSVCCDNKAISENRWIPPIFGRKRNQIDQQCYLPMRISDWRQNPPRDRPRKMSRRSANVFDWRSIRALRSLARSFLTWQPRVEPNPFGVRF